MPLLLLLFSPSIQAHPLSSDIFGHEIRIFVPLEKQDDLVVDYTLEIPISVLQQELNEYERGQEHATAIDFQHRRVSEIGSFVILEVDNIRHEWKSIVLKTETLQRKNQMVVFDLRLQQKIPEGSHIIRIVNQNYPSEKSVYRKELWLKEPYLSLQVIDPENYGHWLMFEDMREIEFSYRTQGQWSIDISTYLRTTALGHPERLQIQKWDVFDQNIWQRMQNKMLFWYELILICGICGISIFERPKHLEWFGVVLIGLLSYFIFPNAFLLWCALFMAGIIMFVFRRWMFLFVIPLCFSTQFSFSMFLVLLCYTIKYLYYSQK
jgi:hypothetical protein